MNRINDEAELVDAIRQHQRRKAATETSSNRLIVAIVGAPGAGKSTLAETLCTELNSVEDPARQTRAVVVPMDGFHLDNVILEQRGQMAVKGSPQTFDVHGFHSLVERLAGPVDQPVYVPLFDRAADLSRNAAQCVDSVHEVVILEGNYLLLKHGGWQTLAPLFDLRVFLDVPFDVLESRLVQRWLDHGLSAEEARTRALSNDIPNAHTVVEDSAEADLYYVSVR